MVKFFENPIEYLRTQGEKPKDVRGRGGAGSITGRQMPPEKSVKEKKAEARKKGQIKPISKSRRYSDNVTKSNTKPGDVFTREPRTIADAKKRKSKTFINKKGKKLAAVTKEELDASGLTLRQYLNRQQGKTAKGSKKKITAKKKNIKKAMGITDNMPQAGGSSIMMGLNKGGMAQGYGRAAMRPGKDPRTISKT